MLKSTIFTSFLLAAIAFIIIQPDFPISLYRISSLLYSFFHAITKKIFSTNDEQFIDVHRFRTDTWDSLKPSSIWCQQQTIHCRIESLCIKLDSHEYIFIFDENRSTFQPADLRSETEQIELGRLSSVSGHNLFTIKHLVTVPYAQISSLNYSLFWIDGKTLLMRRFKPDNLMHLLHDDILPAFSTSRQFGFDRMLDFIFFDDHWNQSQGISLFRALIGTPLLRLQFPPDAVVCFENAYLGISNSTVWYQYGFSVPQSPVARNEDEKKFIRSSIELLRSRLVDSLNLDDHCQPSKSVLIARQLNRRILNLRDLFAYIQPHFENLQLLILEKDMLTDTAKLNELFQTFICSRTLIAMHGSEQILSLLMPPGSTVIEIFPFGIEPSHYTPYRSLANILDHNYHAWTNKRRDNGFFHGNDYPPHWGGLSKLSQHDRNSIERSVEEPLEPHLCCDNPAWLYRIYQDTRIDLHEFGSFLREVVASAAKLRMSPSNVNWLSEVTDLRCLADKQDIMISWKLPWNAQFFAETKTHSLNYEVLLQAAPQNTATLIRTQHANFSIKQTYCMTFPCNVWVRPLSLSKQIVGSFNRVPLICDFRPL